jgi:hypothetical protein
MELTHLALEPGVGSRHHGAQCWLGRGAIKAARSSSASRWTAELGPRGSEVGFLKFIRNINNAEGAREVIRLQYLRHYRMADRAGIEPHSAGLFGALGARRKAGSKWRGEPFLWAELSPFLSMPPEIGREALAEYVVCLERPAEARIGWLRDQINSYLLTPYDSSAAREAREVAAMSLASFGPMLPWAEWLREEVGKSLLEAAAQAAESTEE